MSFCSWVIFGAIAGFLAGKLAGSDRSGCIFNIVIGVVGAFIGGFLLQLFTGESFSFAFDIASFIVAIIGSILLLALTGATRKRQS